MTVFAGLLIPLGMGADPLSDRNEKISVKGVVTDPQGEPLRVQSLTSTVLSNWKLRSGLLSRFRT